MNRRGSVGITLCTLILCLSTAGCGAVPGEPGMLTEEATPGAVSGQRGILAEEAAAGASLDDLTASLNMMLETREASTFAGLWIEQQPYYRVFVAFTSHGQATLERYVAGTPLEGVVQLRTARFTYAELLAAGQEAGRLAQELGFPFSWASDVQGNRAELWVTDLAQFDAALKAADRSLPDPVQVVASYEPPAGPPAGLTPVPGVAFPQIRAGTMMDLLMDLPGEIVLKDGCLRIIPSGEEAGYLIIWQPDYFLNDRQGALEVWDRDGKVVARVGQGITLGLAGLPGDGQVEPYLREPLPVQCPGPTWLMSRIVDGP